MASVPTGHTAWLSRAPSSTAGARVFLLPYAGTGAGLYRSWPRRQGPTEFLPVELPGRESRLGEAVPETFEQLASDLAQGLSGYLDVPYVVFGHCWSALLAYELVIQLAAAGLPGPAHLVVSSQVAPQDGPVGRMLGMTEAEMADEITATIRAFGGQPHPDLVAVYVSVLRADVEVSRRYVVHEPVRVSCPVTAIGWTLDEEVAADRMGGWSRCGDTEFVVLEGRHHRFVDAPDPLLDILAAVPAHA